MITVKEGRLRSVYAIEKDDKEVPDGSLIVGKNGQFEVSNSPVFSFIKPVSKESPLGLKHIQPGLSIKKKISWNEFWVGAQWLRNQWDKHCQGKGKGSGKEFILILFYNHAEDRYFWHPPKQKGSAADVDYTTSEDDDIIEIINGGSVIVGTMHNHFGKGTAFQSGQDHQDEAKHGIPMIHFTMAWMDAPNLFMSEFDIRFVASNYKKELKFDDIVARPEEIKTPEEWDEKLKIAYVPTTTYGGSRSNWSYWDDDDYDYYHPKYGHFTKREDGTWVSSEEEEAWMESFGGFPGYFNRLEKSVTSGSGNLEDDDLESVLEEMAFTRSVMTIGPNGNSVKSLYKRYPNLSSIAKIRELFFGKAILDAIYQDIKSMLVPSDDFIMGTMSKQEMFEIIALIMGAVSKADDMLEKFFVEQDVICDKKDKK